MSFVLRQLHRTILKMVVLNYLKFYNVFLLNGKIREIN